MAWDYPVFIVGAFLLAIAVAVFLIRASDPKRAKSTFECLVCGRKLRGPYPREWRYCPYCGVPRDSTRLADLPGKKSILDV